MKCSHCEKEIEGRECPHCYQETPEESVFCLHCGGRMEEPEEVVTGDPDWDSRKLCSDGACIGIIGQDGNCKECGQPYSGEAVIEEPTVEEAEAETEKPEAEEAEAASEEAEETTEPEAKAKEEAEK